MLAVEHYPSSDFFGNYPLNDFPKHELLEVNRSKVSIHNAKAVQLPYDSAALFVLNACWITNTDLSDSTQEHWPFLLLSPRVLPPKTVLTYQKTLK